MHLFAFIHSQLETTPKKCFNFTLSKVCTYIFEITTTIQEGYIQILAVIVTIGRIDVAVITAWHHLMILPNSNYNVMHDYLSKTTFEGIL